MSSHVIFALPKSRAVGEPEVTPLCLLASCHLCIIDIADQHLWALNLSHELLFQVIILNRPRSSSIVFNPQSSLMPSSPHS